MPTIAQIAARSKRDARKRVEQLKRQAFEARVDALVESGALDSDAPMAERIHKVILTNRPYSNGSLPEPVKVEPKPAPLFDLIIATRRAVKFAGHGQSNDGRITRIKKAGDDWKELKNTFRLSDQVIMARLEPYTLIDQVATSTEIWHRYRLTAFEQEVQL